MSTDIPAKNLPALAELAAGVHLDRVTSIGFVPPQFERAQRSRPATRSRTSPRSARPSPQRDRREPVAAGQAAGGVRLGLRVPAVADAGASGQLLDLAELLVAPVERGAQPLLAADPR